MTINYDTAFCAGGPIDTIRNEMERYDERFQLTCLMLEGVALTDARFENGLVDFVDEVSHQLAHGFLSRYYRCKLNVRPTALHELC